MSAPLTFGKDNNTSGFSLPSTHKRKFNSFNATAQVYRPIKLLKTEIIEIVELNLAIIPTPNRAEATKNFVWMTEHDVKTLFRWDPNTVINDLFQLYAQVADNVYKIALKRWGMIGSIGLNAVQTHDCKSKISTNNLNSYTLVRTFIPKDLDNPNRIKNAVFEIKLDTRDCLFHDFPSQEDSGPITLDVAELRHLLNELLAKQYMRQYQAFFIDHVKGPFVFALKKMEFRSPIFKEGAETGIPDLWSQLGMIDELTHIDFEIADEDDDIVLVDQALDNGMDRLAFSVSIDDHIGNDLKTWKRPRDLLPLVLKAEDLDSSIKSYLKDQKIAIGYKTCLNMGSDWNVKFKLTGVKAFVPPPPPTSSSSSSSGSSLSSSSSSSSSSSRPSLTSSNSSASSSNRPLLTSSSSSSSSSLVLYPSFSSILSFLPHATSPNLFNYKSIFKVLERSLQFTGDKDIIIVNHSTPIRNAKKMTFRIIDLQTEKHHNSNMQSWVSAKELSKQIRSLIKPLVKNQRLLIDILANKYLIELTNVFGKSKNAANMEKHAVVMWRAKKATKMKFCIKKGVDLALVDDDKEIPNLTKLKLKVKTKEVSMPFMAMFGKEEPSSSSVIDKEELNDLIEEFPTTLISKQNLTATTGDGDSLEFSVAEMEFDSKIKQESEYRSIGHRVPETVIEFISEPKSNITIVDNVIDIPNHDVDEVLAKLGLGGLAVKFKSLIRNVMLSRGKLKHEMERRRLKPVKGVLLYGPPGTGKTTLARSLGKLLGCDEERIKMLAGPSIWNKWLGNSEKNVRQLFEPAIAAFEKYKEKSPLYVIIIDEIDAILGTRSSSINDARVSVVNEFLGQIDGLKQLNNILVVGLTNNKQMLDPAALRPGRLEVHLEIGIPDGKSRKQIFNIYLEPLRKENLLDDDLSIDYLVSRTEKWSGADIEGLVRRATSFSLERLDALNLPLEEVANHPAGKLTRKDFEQAFEEINSDTDTGHLSMYA